MRAPQKSPSAPPRRGRPPGHHRSASRTTARHRGPSRRSTARRTLILLALTACAVPAVLRGDPLPWSDPPATGTRATGTTLRSTSPTPSPSVMPSPTVTRSPRAEPTPETRAPSSGPVSGPPGKTYAENGPGTFVWASSASGRAGRSGKLVRYGVKIENGTGLDPASVAAEIDSVFRDKRSWTGQGVASFQHVSAPPYDMVVQIVSPGTADRLCGSWGLDTGGELNCANAPNLIVNVRRWVELSDQYRGKPHDYHALIINHEAGHVLGYGHRGCPGPGKPAPAMMQQIKGLHGCVANPWVYSASGKFLDGPRLP